MYPQSISKTPSAMLQALLALGHQDVIRHHGLSSTWLQWINSAWHLGENQKWLVSLSMFIPPKYGTIGVDY